MRYFCQFLLLFACASSYAQSLDRLDQVDLIELDPKTSQIQLLVILGEDRANTRQAVKALYKKFNNYQDFITSGQAVAAAPTGSTTLRPVVVLVGPKEATSGEMQNLAGLKLAASKVGAAVEVRPYEPGLRPKPIAINRVPPKRGA
jgi:hypothetical protein